MSVFFLQHPKETDLALFAGGEAGPFARWRIERHVESCERCQSLTAAYFRLPDELSELAEVPNIDWNEIASSIEAGVRSDRLTAAPERRGAFVPPITWQAGLAVAGVVIMLVMVGGPEQEPAAEEAAPTVVAEVAIDEAPEPVAAVAPTPVIVAEASADEGRRETSSNEEAKAVASPDVLVSDVAAPAPPPPPAFASPVAQPTNNGPADQPVALAAESAEERLRSDAAARVGAVSATGGVGGVPPPTYLEWRSHVVAAVNFDDAPVQLLSGSSLVAHNFARAPNMTVTNRSGRTISRIEVVWVVGDFETRAMARFTSSVVPVTDGAIAWVGADMPWILPLDIPRAMRAYASEVVFDDGTSWSPSPAQVEAGGVTTPAAATHEMMQVARFGPSAWRPGDSGSYINRDPAIQSPQR